MIKSYEPNAFGLYDISGNITEMVWDIYGDHTEENKINPIGISDHINITTDR